MEREWITTREAMQDFGVPDLTLREWMRTGAVISRKNGDAKQARVWILAADVNYCIRHLTTSKTEN